jgi:hypothetical protein
VRAREEAKGSRGRAEAEGEVDGEAQRGRIEDRTRGKSFGCPKNLNIVLVP